MHRLKEHRYRVGLVTLIPGQWWCGALLRRLGKKTFGKVSLKLVKEWKISCAVKNRCLPGSSGVVDRDSTWSARTECSGLFILRFCMWRLFSRSYSTQSLLHISTFDVQRAIADVGSNTQETRLVLANELIRLRCHATSYSRVVLRPRMRQHPMVFSLNTISGLPVGNWK